MSQQAVLIRGNLVDSDLSYIVKRCAETKLRANAGSSVPLTIARPSSNNVSA
jgi:hypothetical protein